MKKILLVLVLLLIGVSAIAENVKSIGEFDGDDWVRWDDNQKSFFVGGFLAAFSVSPPMVISYLETQSGQKIPAEAKRALYELFYTELSIGDIVYVLDGFYQTPEYREMPIGFTIVMIMIRCKQLKYQEGIKTFEDLKGQI